MKTYILIISNVFPKTHLKAGKPTYFMQQILNTTGKIKMYPFTKKIHTIRTNYLLWKKRVDEINEGNAVLSLRYWNGKPYRSKQLEFLQLDKTSGIGIEKLEFNRFLGIFINYVDSDIELETISKNDGLELPDFKEWFRNYNLNEAMAIIHFTDFRYCVRNEAV